MFCRGLFLSSRWRFVAAAALTGVRAAVTALYVLGIAVLVEGAATGQLVNVRVLAGILGAWIAAQLLDSARQIVVPGLQARWTARMTEGALTTLLVDQGSSWDRARKREEADAVLERVRSWMGLSCISAVWHAVDARVLGIVGLAFVWRWSPVAAIIVTLAQLVSGWMFTRYLDTVHRDLMADETPERRRTQYLRDLVLNPQSAHEVRLFGLSPWLLTRHHRDWLSSIQVIWARRQEAIRPGYASLLGLSVAMLLVVIYLGYELASGTIGVGETTAAVQGLVLSAGLGMLGDTLVQVRRARIIDQSVCQLAAQTSSMTTPTDLCPLCDGGRGLSAPGVVARGLKFSYSVQYETLHGIDMDIPRGAKVAVVGENGAGKSTLTRLLAGMDPPSGGWLRIDGVPPHELCARHRPAVVFQTFMRLPASLKDNIEVGHEDSHSYSAATRASGSDRLRVGDETVLSSQVRGGTDLSGGEWQRVALARAFAAVERGSSMLILDEPTAALDVRVEREVFQRVMGTETTVTTILVTHRLASVRGADYIIVLKGGRVTETGTHESLMAEGGTYADMFQRQAALYGLTAEMPVQTSEEPVR